MEFNQDDLQIAMIKKSGIYMFLGYCIKPGKRTYKGSESRQKDEILHSVPLGAGIVSAGRVGMSVSGG